MPLYKPFGILPGEVADYSVLEKEFLEAKKIAKNTTSWQWKSREGTGLNYKDITSNGSGVIVEQRQRAAVLLAGEGENNDARNIKYAPTDLSAPLYPWPIPYLRGWKSVWGGELDLEWTSSYSELVLVGYSFFLYRLSSESEGRSQSLGYEGFFDDKIQPRIKFGVNIDGSIVEGSGCGTNEATNGPEMVAGAGSRQKAIVSSSTSVQMLGAGSHRISPVAAQGPANQTDKDNYYRTEEIKTTDGSLEEPNNGVVVVNARIHVIRFPRGRNFGA